ncbi:hypothetical protein [Bacillus sp. 3255]|uniref:hypothetical protein n=1 Tax=Bacillus sp. 3255 TaxID=2817904 RepID=UPI00285F405D|nr:hypothetical protein [Bacillus sp. 3255]MDR6883039.1 hypothetical protein [Bacillus sp. 3255]
MRYEVFKSRIIESDPIDWIYDDELGLFVLTSDIQITILTVRDDNFDNEFHESWVERYSDPKAYRKKYLLKYNGNTIETFYTVAVDGYRMDIPYPKRPEMTITNEQYRLGKIINRIHRGHGFDDYLERADIKIVE